MPDFHGSFVGKVNSQAMTTVTDVPDHDLSIVQISGPQTVSDPLWKDATVSYYGMADLVAGTGNQSGYYVNKHPNGDTDHGTFQAKVTTAASGVTIEGTWTSKGGTGQFAKVSGHGTYKGVMTSPTEVKTDWKGSYQLG